MHSGGGRGGGTGGRRVHVCEWRRARNTVAQPPGHAAARTSAARGSASGRRLARPPKWWREMPLAWMGGARARARALANATRRAFRASLAGARRRAPAPSGPAGPVVVCASPTRLLPRRLPRLPGARLVVACAKKPIDRSHSLFSGRDFRADPRLCATSVSFCLGHCAPADGRQPKHKAKIRASGQKHANGPKLEPGESYSHLRWARVRVRIGAPRLGARMLASWNELELGE